VIAADDDGSTVFNSARLVKFSHQPAVVQYLFIKHIGLVFTWQIKRQVTVNMIIAAIVDSDILSFFNKFSISWWVLFF
jgi:hypothetical protein